MIIKILTLNQYSTLICFLPFLSTLELLRARCVILKKCAINGICICKSKNNDTCVHHCSLLAFVMSSKRMT